MNPSWSLRIVEVTEKSPTTPRLFEAIVGMSKGVALMNCRSDWYGNPNGKTEICFFGVGDLVG